MSAKRFVTSLLLILIFISVYPSILSSSGFQNTVKDIRFRSHENFTRIVIECKNEISYTKNLIQSPSRLYFDLVNTLPAGFHQRKIKIDDDAVNMLRVGRHDQNTTRIVLGLKSYKDFNIYTLENPFRLVVEINFKNPIEKYLPRKKVVVIDPGHGGKDPGAIGRRRLKEKDVVLAIARKLKKILETKYAVKVYLTRNSDRYLELGERTAFANRKGADLFVSIHANASRNRKTKGIETWFLNYTDKEEYLKVAARENAISLEKQKEAQTIEGKILTSLADDFKRDRSLRLAHTIQNSLIKNLRTRHKKQINDLNVKYAPFYVLLGADMPSALVEVGFITNLHEERMLRKLSYRKDIAFAIAKGVNAYLSTLPDTPKLARR